MASNKKKIFFLLLPIMFLWSNASAQISRDSIEYRVKEIKNEFENINQDTAKFKVVESDVFGLSAEGGFVRKYYDGTKLRKAILTLYGETGQSTTEYYLQNNLIIFVFEKHLRYSAPIYIGNTEIKSQEEDRYYLYMEHLIKWIDNTGKGVNLSQFPEKEEEIVDGFEIIK